MCSQNSTSSQRILTKGRIAVLSPLATENGFVRHWPASNTCFFWHKRASPPKRHLDRFSRFSVHHSKGPQCFAVGRTSPILSLRLEDLHPHLIHGSLGPHESAPIPHIDWFSHFLHTLLQRLWMRFNGANNPPPQISHSLWRSAQPSN